MARLALLASWLTATAIAVTGGVLRGLSGSTAPTNAEVYDTFHVWMESHLYLGWAVMLCPWPLFLLKASPRIAPLWAGIGLWAVAAVALATGLGTPPSNGWTFYTPYAPDGGTTARYTTTLLLTGASGSVIACLAGVRRSEGWRLVPLALQVGLCLAFATLGASWATSNDPVLSLNAHPMTQEWVVLWALPVAAGAILLGRRWHGAASLGAWLALLTTVSSAFAVGRIGFLEPVDVYLHDTLLMSVLTHHGIYGWPLLLLLGGYALSRTQADWSTYTALGVTAFGIVIDLGAASWLGVDGMPSRYATYPSTFDWQQTVAAIGGWIATSGFLLILMTWRIGYRRTEH